MSIWSVTEESMVAVSITKKEFARKRLVKLTSTLNRPSRFNLNHFYLFKQSYVFVYIVINLTGFLFDSTGTGYWY